MLHVGLLCPSFAAVGRLGVGIYRFLIFPVCNISLTFYKLLFSLGMPTFIINRPLPSVNNRYAVILSGKYCLTQVGDIIMAIISSIKYELVTSDFTFELINKAGNTCEDGRFESSENLSDNEPKKDVEGVPSEEFLLHRLQQILIQIRWSLFLFFHYLITTLGLWFFSVQGDMYIDN